MNSTTIKELDLNEIMSVSGAGAPPNCRVVPVLVGCDAGPNTPGCRVVPTIVCDGI